MKPESALKLKSRYSQYIDDIKEDISSVMQEFGCQPILFIGSGLSRRYMNAPNWDELLSHLAKGCGNIGKGLGFYKQSLKSPMLIGEEFARLYQEWAWTAGRSEFPEEMFDDSADAQAYIKYKISTYLSNLTPKETKDIGSLFHEKEIESLVKIKPHAIITTNYDCMLEKFFPDHEPVIGQRILKGQQFCIGEIYKIHGCVTEPSSLVFTESDYNSFAKKKKFLSAKLLTFFNEHPLIFIGYSATDPNIRAILSDIDEALPEKGGMVPNVYILEWSPEIDENYAPPRDKTLQTEEDRTVRVKLILAKEFGWVFDAFAANPVLNAVSPKVLRSLIARSYELVRHDIPKIKVQADFKMLTESVENSEKFATLFGIASIKDWSIAYAYHPLSPTQLGKKLGGTNWYKANQLIDKVKLEKGIDIKSSDNRYHRGEMINNNIHHKYSDDAFMLLKKVRDGESYVVDLGI